MSDNEDRRSRDLELLRGAVERDRQRGSDAGKKPKKEGARPGMMYRGQPVAGRGGGGRAPGAPGGGGAQRGGSSGGDSDVQASLQKLTQLFNDGLITKAEFDAKRGEILDRL